MLDALLTPEDPVPGEITNGEHERDQGFSLFILVKRNQSNIFPMALQCPKKCLGVVYIQIYVAVGFGCSRSRGTYFRQCLTS